MKATEKGSHSSTGVRDTIQKEISDSAVVTGMTFVLITYRMISGEICFFLSHKPRQKGIRMSINTIKKR